MLKHPMFDYLMTIPRRRGYFQRLDLYVRSYDHLWEILTLHAFYDHITVKASDCVLSELSNIVLSVYFASHILLIVVINYTCCISICDITFINTCIPVLTFLLPLIERQTYTPTMQYTLILPPAENTVLSRQACYYYYC